MSSTSTSNPKIKCQCGAVSFPAPLPNPTASYICHCTECQKQSGSAFGCSAIFPAADFWPPSDDLRSKLGMWTRPTEKGNTMECYFCQGCGVRVLHRVIYPDGTPRDTVTVKGGCLEGFDFKGATHIWTQSAQVAVPEESFPQSPV